MIVTSNLLGDLQRSIGRAVAGVFQSALDITNVVTPTIELEVPFVHIGAPSAGTIQRSTFGLEHVINQAPSSAAVFTSLATLGQGLWEITAHGSGWSNYFTTTDNYGYSIDIFNAGLTATQALLHFHLGGTATNIVGHDNSTKFKFLLPVDGNVIRVSVAATAAGQNCAYISTLLCRKLMP